jgi:hypothetical protein
MSECNSGVDTCDDNRGCSGKDECSGKGSSSGIRGQSSMCQCSGMSYHRSADSNLHASADSFFMSQHLSRKATNLGSPFYRLHLDLPIFLNAADFHVQRDTLYAYHVYVDASYSSSALDHPLELSFIVKFSEHYFMIHTPAPSTSNHLLSPSCRSAPCGPAFASMVVGCGHQGRKNEMQQHRAHRAARRRALFAWRFSFV